MKVVSYCDLLVEVFRLNFSYVLFFFSKWNFVIYKENLRNAFISVIQIKIQNAMTTHGGRYS